MAWYNLGGALYPYRHSRKTLVVLITLASLGSMFLSTWKSNTTNAKAYFPPENAEPKSISNLPANQLIGSVNQAPDNVVDIDSRVSSKTDDAEQRLSDGRMFLINNQMELVYDPKVARDDQSIGLRFTNINIPRGATIVQAYLELQVSETSSEATSLVITGQDADDAGGFTRDAYDVTSRSQTSASASWNNIPAWDTVGARVQSPDLSSVIQEVVDRTGWASGNSLVLLINGSGRRMAETSEAGSDSAPLLHIQYSQSGSTSTPPPSTPTPSATTPAPTQTATATIQPTTQVPTGTVQPPTQTPTETVEPPSPTNTPVSTSQPLVSDTRIRVPYDDVEQRASDGFMYINSTDLELVEDPGVLGGAQSVGMRFSNVSVPQGATIVQAYLEFQVDETSSESTSLEISGQDVDNAGSFTSAAFNVSNRVKTNSNVSWNNISTWNSVGAKVQTPDLSSVVQEIVNRSGWVEGNSLVIIMDGLGRRVAAAYEANPAGAALLHIVYLPVITTATPTPPSPPNPDPTPVGQTGNWNMIFRDEFNGGSLDTSKWHTCFWWSDVTCTIETNNEMELYNPEDVLIQNGLLRLRAQRRDMVAWNGETYHYTSGMVMTGGRSGKIAPGLIFTYGYAEAKVKIPVGQGLWPAFWMLPADYNSRPEIDIMEILGHETDIYHMNYHYIGGDQGETWTGPDFSAGWHVLGVDWSADAIIWYVDGVELWRFTDTSKISNEDSYLLLNLAVGGNWPGPPDSSTVFPSYMDVEYVRVWQR